MELFKEDYFPYSRKMVLWSYLMLSGIKDHHCYEPQKDFLKITKP